ncbi:unnamed protein product [Linum trigynum]|uniref:Uncharacterized protein n=1 Tax=Linum trigynum TaxID=586398 RepID=A0AAV2GL23_9ROSI
MAVGSDMRRRAARRVEADWRRRETRSARQLEAEGDGGVAGGGAARVDGELVKGGDGEGGRGCACARKGWGWLGGVGIGISRLGFQSHRLGVVLDFGEGVVLGGG